MPDPDACKRKACEYISLLLLKSAPQGLPKSHTPLQYQSLKHLGHITCLFIVTGGNPTSLAQKFQRKVALGEALAHLYCYDQLAQRSPAQGQPLNALSGGKDAWPAAHTHGVQRDKGDCQTEAHHPHTTVPQRERNPKVWGPLKPAWRQMLTVRRVEA